MADPLVEQYERQYLQQAELFEETAVAGLRSAFADFSRRYLQILRSVPVNRQASSQASGTGDINPLTAAQEEMEVARDTAQRQLATALAKGLRTISNLPFSANEPTLSETSNQAANAEQEGDNLDSDSVSNKSEDGSECECGCESVHSVEIEIKEEIENQPKMDTAGAPIINSNTDNVSVLRETESTSSDLVSNNEVEVTGNTTDETMRHSECAQVNMEDEQTRDLSGIINFVAINHPLPLVPYESSEEEDDNERENLVDVYSFDLPSMNDSALSMTASTSTGRYEQSRNKDKAKYAEPIKELSVDIENSVMTGIRKRKSKVSFSGTVKKVRQLALEAQTTDAKEPLKVITKRLCCPQAGCPKVCKDKKRLDVHLKTKHSIDEYRCLVSKCKRSFKYKSVLSDHLLHGHGKRSNWPCDLCSSSFLNHDMLYKHNYSLHEEGLFECSVDDCDFKATIRRKVVNHQISHRTPKHTCPVASCGRSYVRTSDLESHIRLHTKEPYVCGQCDKTFAHRSGLYAHLLVHRGLATARCTWPDCTYQAISPGNVVKHVRTAHYGLPQTLKKQAQLGIIDSRNAYDFLEKI